MELGFCEQKPSREDSLPSSFFPSPLPSLPFSSVLHCCLPSLPVSKPPMQLMVLATPAESKAEMRTQWHVCDVVSPENVSGGNYIDGREGDRVADIARRFTSGEKQPLVAGLPHSLSVSVSMSM